jgi:two-component system sensor histidine kinase/response regulator
VWETLSTVPHCGIYGKPWLALLHLGGNIGVFVAYMLIPAAIAYVWRKRRFGFHRKAQLFAAFIFFCGLGHALAITAWFYGWYWAEGVNMVVTAGVSLYTAGYVFYSIPKLLTIPTPEEHERLVEHIKQVVPDGWVAFYQSKDVG